VRKTKHLSEVFPFLTEVFRWPHWGEATAHWGGRPRPSGARMAPLGGLGSLFRASTQASLKEDCARHAALRASLWQAERGGSRRHGRSGRRRACRRACPPLRTPAAPRAPRTHPDPCAQLGDEAGDVDDDDDDDDGDDDDDAAAARQSGPSTSVKVLQAGLRSILVAWHLHEAVKHASDVAK